MNIAKYIACAVGALVIGAVTTARADTPYLAVMCGGWTHNAGEPFDEVQVGKPPTRKEITLQVNVNDDSFSRSALHLDDQGGPVECYFTVPETYYFYSVDDQSWTPTGSELGKIFTKVNRVARGVRDDKPNLIGWMIKPLHSGNGIFDATYVVKIGRCAPDEYASKKCGH